VSAIEGCPVRWGRRHKTAQFRTRQEQILSASLPTEHTWANTETSSTASPSPTLTEAKRPSLCSATGLARAVPGNLSGAMQVSPDKVGPSSLACLKVVAKGHLNLPHTSRPFKCTRFASGGVFSFFDVLTFVYRRRVAAMQPGGR
jgi:hypothetical protein